MQNYLSAKGMGRAASPLKEPSQQPANQLPPDVVAERQRRGAGARVEIPHTNASDDYESDPAPHRQISRPPQRRAAQSASQLRKTQLQHNEDFFDTDSENADATTITNLSNGFDEDQLRQQNGYAPYGYQGEVDRESNDAGSSQFALDENPEVDGRGINPAEAAILQGADRQTGGGGGPHSIFAQSEPYPSTTDPDAESEDNEVEHEPEVYRQDGTYMHAPWPTPQEYLQPPATYALQDPYTAMRSKDPALQENIRPKTRLPLRSDAAKTEYAQPPGTKPAQTAQQHQPSHTKSVQRAPPPQPMDSQTPTNSPPPIPNAETPNAGNHFIDRGPFSQQQPPRQHQMPPTPSEAGSELALDYDAAELKQMPYASLADEPFDHVPHAADELPPSATTGELPDRLTTAFAEPNPAEQAAFFATLTLDEWEDAGDWFLARFGDLVHKAKEARRAKRNAAHDLEEEIRKRSEVVGRKKRCVEEEIGKMRNKGQTLLPDTPARRRAATPFSQR